MLDRIFLRHPRSVGETYAEHMGKALSFGVTLLAAGFVCLVHAILPCLFQKTASSLVASLHDRMVTNRVRRSAANPAASFQAQVRKG